MGHMSSAARELIDLFIAIGALSGVLFCLIMLFRTLLG